MSQPAPTATPQEIEIISYRNIRKAIGWLGISLPFVLLIFNWLINTSNWLNNEKLVTLQYKKPYEPAGSWKFSISHYYYTTVGELFTGILIAVSIFMFCYKGYPKRPGEKGFSDNLLTKIAGLSALGIVLFPTGASAIPDNFRIFTSTNLVGGVHFTFAMLFFISLSIMSMVNFRRTPFLNQMGKTREDKWYLTSGIGMLVCIGLIGVYVAFEDKLESLKVIRPVYALEAIMLSFFGSSWLLKGKTDFAYLPKKLGLMKEGA